MIFVRWGGLCVMRRYIAFVFSARPVFELADVVGADASAIVNFFHALC